MRIQIFIVAWSLVLGLVLVYLGVGAAHDGIHRAVEKRRQRVLAVLAVLLFESDLEAEAIHERAGRLSKRALFSVIQTVAFDIEGQARERLRSLVRTTGLHRYVRRRARSWRWRVRIQAAQLHYLLDDSDIERFGLLGDPHPLVRARAVESLTPDQAMAYVPWLLAMLAEPDPAVRWTAKHCLLGIGGRIVPDLLEFLANAEQDWALEALEVAANVSDPRLSSAIRRHGDSADPSVRRMVVRALSNGGGCGVEETLIEALMDTDSEVRVAALEGLNRLGAVSSVATIGRLMRDRSWIVRSAAGLALDGLGAPGRLMLRSYRTDIDPFARDMAKRTLDARVARMGTSVGTTSDPQFEVETRELTVGSR